MLVLVLQHVAYLCGANNTAGCSDLDPSSLLGIREKNPQTCDACEAENCQQVPLLSLLVLLRRSWLRPDMVCCIRKHQDITDPEEQKPYGSPKYRDCSSVPTFNIWVSGTEVLEDKGSFVLYHSS
ncbi:hypothetical protein Y1Q_0009931 [Alligator mississippiensis]|uniref:Uncharacterized protein n=1 Tax=Alligator mississippiensis TaxID=8496 RepID=A0A151MX77_ALLMI|nr:hypothetical protein Y1Q_0009931 [Alligator mississippiensis]